jgi:diphosphomevalonate decarboxylase
MTARTAIAHPNLALVKYWGKRDVALNLPAVSSLSLGIAEWSSTTTVTWGADADAVWLSGAPAPAKFADKALRHLDRIDPARPPCRVDTHNDFPTGAGLASSASGFAALTVAGLAAAGRSLDPRAASALARQGSGSACRSIPGGWAVWRRGADPLGADSVAEGLDVAWDVRLVIAVAETAEKAVGSTEGMARSQATSPLWTTWVETAEADVDEALAAIRSRDLERLGVVCERSTHKMFATMFTATPPLIYWRPATIAVLHEVLALRAAGVGAWATMDAGPQVKVLCASADAQRVAAALGPHVRSTRIASPGGPARIVA